MSSTPAGSLLVRHRAPHGRGTCATAPRRRKQFPWRAPYACGAALRELSSVLHYCTASLGRPRRATSTRRRALGSRTASNPLAYSKVAWVVGHRSSAAVTRTCSIVRRPALRYGFSETSATLMLNPIVVLLSQLWRHHRAERLRQPRKDISTHHPSNSAVRVRWHDAEGVPASRFCVRTKRSSVYFEH